MKLAHEMKLNPHILILYCILKDPQSTMRTELGTSSFGWPEIRAKV